MEVVNQPPFHGSPGRTDMRAPHRAQIFQMHVSPVPGMRHEYGRNHAELFHFIQLVVSHGLAVNHDRPQDPDFLRIFRGLCGSFFKGCQILAGGRVSIAVGQELIPFLHSRLHPAVCLLLRVGRVAAISLFPLIRLPKPCGASLGRAVKNDLRSSDFQPVMVLLIIFRILFSCLFQIVRQHIRHHIQMEHLLFCALCQLLKTGSIGGAILHCGDSVFQVDLLRLFQLPREIRLHSGEHRNQNLHHSRDFLNVAIRRPIFLPAEFSALRVRRIRRNPALPQKHAVRHTHMAGSMQDADRNGVGHPVQDLFRRMLLLVQKIMVISVAHQDLSFCQPLFFQPVRKRHRQVLKAGAFPQIRKIRILGQHGNMTVGINKGWHQRLSFQIDLFRARQTLPPRLRKLSHIADFSVRDKNRLRRVRLFPHGDDISAII